MGSSLGPDALFEMAEHVVAFTVTSGEAGTNGVPPRGTIDVREVLRGTLTMGPHAASFPPPNDASWYAMRGDGDAGLAAWKAQPLTGPPLGAALIAAMYRQADGCFAVDPRACWPDNDGRRARILWAAGAAVTIITTAADDIDGFEAMAFDERRERSGGWQRFGVRSCRLLDTFFMFATHSDLGVFQCAPEHVAGDPLTTCLWPYEQVVEVLPRLEMLVETDADATARALQEHGGGLADLSRISAALRTGEWPDGGDPAEETAAFAYQLLRYARTAASDRMGVCWEWRGEPRAQVSPAPTARTWELEATYARFRATPTASTRAELVARLAAMTPAEVGAWALAHYAFLGALLHGCIERGESDAPFARAARKERTQWAEVRAGSRPFVEENLAPVPTAGYAYASYFEFPEAP